MANCITATIITTSEIHPCFTANRRIAPIRIGAISSFCTDIMTTTSFFPMFLKKPDFAPASTRPINSMESGLVAAPIISTV